MTFVLVHHTLLDHPVLRGTGLKRRAYDETSAFTWLLMEAARTAHVRDGIPLKRGQLCHSYRFIAKAFGWTTPKVQRFLDKLKTHTMVDTLTVSGRLVISICNYSKYQAGMKELKAASDTPSDTRPIHDRYKPNHGNNKKKDVGDTREVEDRGLGKDPSPTPAPKYPNPAFPYALVGQEELDLNPKPAPEAVSFVADPDPVVPAQDPDPVVLDPVVLDPVPPEPERPELAAPAAIITAVFHPVAFSTPAPDVPPIPPDNVVHMAEHEAKRTRKAKPKAEPPTRWDPDREVPPGWIEAGHQVRQDNGLPWADLEAEARRFARHHAHISGKSTTERGWKATWLNWVDKPLSNQGVSHVQRHHASAQQQRSPQRNAAMGALAAALEKHDDYPEDPGFWDRRG